MGCRPPMSKASCRSETWSASRTCGPRTRISRPFARPDHGARRMSATIHFMATTLTSRLRFSDRALTRKPLLQLLHRLVDRERGGTLAQREFLIALQVLPDDHRSRQRDVPIRDDPVIVGIRTNIGAFIGVSPKVVADGARRGPRPPGGQ